MDGISNEYIDNAIDQLIDSFGIKESQHASSFLRLINQSKVEECIQQIARILNLPIKISVTYVEPGYRPDSNGFHSQDLVLNKGRSVQGITAQVSIPGNLPMYGSESLKNFPINVKLNRNCADQPESFVAVMAHELSHVVLYSTGHKEKDNEVYTDLTAMILGFAGIYQRGRKHIQRFDDGNQITTTTITYGYLSDEQFDFAYTKIMSTLNPYTSKKKDVIKRLRTYHRNINKNKKSYADVKELLTFVQHKKRVRMSPEDVNFISSFYQYGKMDSFHHMIDANHSLHAAKNQSAVTLIHFLPKHIRFLDDLYWEIDLLDRTFEKDFEPVNKLFQMLQKHRSVYQKFRNFFSERILKLKTITLKERGSNGAF